MTLHASLRRLAMSLSTCTLLVPLAACDAEGPSDASELRGDTLDPDALEEYRATLDPPAGTPRDFHKRLAQQGLLVEQKGKFAPTGFGTLLFGRQPRELLVQAGLLGTIQLADAGGATVAQHVVDTVAALNAVFACAAAVPTPAADSTPAMSAAALPEMAAISTDAKIAT